MLDFGNIDNSDFIFIIDGKTLKISYHFDEILDLYCGAMRNIDTVIFEDFQNMFKFSRFDKQITLTPNIKYLTFGYSFNKPIMLTSRLVYLTFGYSFNLPIILTKRIQHLIFDNYFNCSLILTPCLTHITFGEYFDRPIILTKRLTHVVFGKRFNQLILLTPKIKHLIFGDYFNQTIVFQPKITHVEFGYSFEKPTVLTSNIVHFALGSDCYDLIDGLTDNIEELELKEYFNLPILNLPNSVRSISNANCEYEYGHLLPQKLIHWL